MYIQHDHTHTHPHTYTYTYIDTYAATETLNIPKSGITPTAEAPTASGYYTYLFEMIILRL